MKEGMSLQDLATELQRQRAAMRDFKAPTTKMRLETDGQFKLLGSTHVESFGANDLFNRQLTSWAGIPKKYVDLMAVDAPELLATNVNHWLGATADTRLVRTLDGNARAFLSHRYRVIDNVDVLESVFPILSDRQVAFVSQSVTEQHLYIKAVSPKKTIEVRKGDKVQFGVSISNSEVGMGAVHVDPLVYTLACLNGAVVADAGLRKFHIGRRVAELEESVEVFQDDTRQADNKAFFLKLRDVVNAAFDEATTNELAQSLTEGAVRKISRDVRLDAVVEVTSQKYGLNETEGEGVLRRLIEGGDLTQWGLSSAVTSYCQEANDYERATELEKVGGAIAVLDEKEWKELVH